MIKRYNLKKFLLIIFCILNIFYSDKKSSKNISDNKIINIAYVADQKFASLAATSIASLLTNAKEDDEIKIYIIQTDFNELMKERILSLKSIKNCYIEFIKFDIKKINPLKTDNYSGEVFMKVFVPDTLSQLDKILFIDADTIINTSLRELYNTDLKDKYLGAVQIQSLQSEVLQNRIRPDLNQKFYFNSGVILFNAKKFREDKILKKVLIEFKEHKLIKVPYISEEAPLVNILNGNIIVLDLKWNLCPIVFYQSESYYKIYSCYTIDQIKEAINNPAIIHFSDYSYLFLDHPYSSQFFYFYKMTPWLKDFKQEILINHRHNLKKYLLEMVYLSEKEFQKNMADYAKYKNQNHH